MRKLYAWGCIYRDGLDSEVKPALWRLKGEVGKDVDLT